MSLYNGNIIIRNALPPLNGISIRSLCVSIKGHNSENCAALNCLVVIIVYLREVFWLCLLYMQSLQTMVALSYKQ